MLICDTEEGETVRISISKPYESDNYC